MTQRHYYRNFDWLRLFLAVEVVAAHSGIASNGVPVSPVPGFLAISGFVVMGSLEHRTAWQFLAARALRVLPLLAVMFAYVGWQFGLDAMIQNILFWLWLDNRPPVNSVVWTLTYEELFYLMLLLIGVAGGYRWRWIPVALAMSCMVAVAYSDAYRSLGGFAMLGGAFFLGNAMYLYRREVAAVPAWAACAFSVIAFTVAFLAPYDAIVRPNVVLQDFVSFAALIVLAVAGPQLPRLTMDLSYSLYLLHLFFRDALVVSVGLGWTLFALVLALCLPLCVASWFLIERPALRLKPRNRATLR